MFQELEDWKRQRLGKFTASEIHKLLVKGKGKEEYFGKGAITYINEKLAEMITGQPAKELEGLAALEWGSAHEYEALMAVQEKLNIELQIYGGTNNKFIPFNEYSGGSPDAETNDSIVEAKCPINSAIHTSNLLGSLSKNPNEWLAKNRAEYYAQLQFNMMCAKKDKGFFISYDPRPLAEQYRLVIIEVGADLALQKEIAERIEKAGEYVSGEIEKLETLTNPSILLAHHDSEVGATIVETEFNPSLLKKIS